MIKNQAAFYLLSVLIGILAIATMVEKAKGTQTVLTSFYHTGWFLSCWIAVAITGGLLLVKRRMWLNKPSLWLHLSLLLILTGALVTHLSSVSGKIHLRKGFPQNTFTATHQRFWEPDQVWELQKLPFSLTLEEFIVHYYPGTRAPANYESKVLLGFPDGKKTRACSISMNHILRNQGYRFYQNSFDPDHEGTILAVNYDPYGIPITYLGYALLVLSMGAVLWNPKGAFRSLLRHPVFRKASMFFLLCTLPSVLVAQERDSEVTPVTATQTLRIKKKVIPKELALQIGQLQVLYNDRIAPLQTLARDFTLKLTGHTSYQGLEPEQIVCGWLFCPEQWQYEPMIKIKSKALQYLLEISSPAPLVSFFGSDRAYKLQEFESLKFQDKVPVALHNSLAETDEKVQLILMLTRGSLLKPFPLKSEGRIQWYSITDSIPDTVEGEKIDFIREVSRHLSQAIAQEDYTVASEIVKKIALFQHQEGRKTVRNKYQIKAELFYNRYEPTRGLTGVCLAAGIIGFLLLIWKPDTTTRGLHRVLCGVLSMTLLFSTATLLLRSYISGRVPLSNGYETLLLLSWIIQLLALLLRKKFPLALPFGFLLAGCTFLVSTLGQMNPQITPLRPVLSSPWLSLHVSLIMTAYALFAFTFLSGLTSVVYYFQHRNKEIVRLTVLSRLLLYPATFLLGTGLFVGAVWANVSWGSYWAWDPKEVWALISFLIYAIPLHERCLPFFRHPLGFHLYVMGAFSTLLMTYFGVNYFLGGMHSYAG